MMTSGEQGSEMEDTAMDEIMKANEKYLHDFFVKHQRTILENTIQEYRVMFIYDNIPLLLGYVCLFVLGVVANGVQIYATTLQIRRNENTVCSKMFLQLAISQTLLIVYLIPMDYLWRYSQVWEAGERACQLLVWIRFYLIVTVAAFTVLQTLVRYRVMKASAEIFKCGPPQPEEPAKLSVGTTASTSFSLQRDSGKVLDSSVEITSVHVRENGVNVGKLNSFVQIAKAMGHAITFIACWPKRYVFLNKPNITCEEGNNSNFDRRLRKRSFNENRLIILGWVLPLLLCAPEAAVYKLHVHKDIGGYQQCADIFVKQEELLFPRLFPSSANLDDGSLALAGNQDESSSSEALDLSMKKDSAESLAALISEIDDQSGSGAEGEQASRDSSSNTNFSAEVLVTGSPFAGDLAVTSSNELDVAPMTPFQIVYYLLLQSLTFVIPVGAILILNALVVKCYWQIRQRNAEQLKISEAGKVRHDGTNANPPLEKGYENRNFKEVQLRELKNWAARSTVLLTLSFGVSYIVCWLPLTMLMALRWNALFIHTASPDTSSEAVQMDGAARSAGVDSENKFNYPQSEVDFQHDTSSLGFWAFVEEWAIAWGLLIGVVNPLLYGFFHFLGGNHKRLYDLQICAGLVRSDASLTSNNNNIRIRELFSSSKVATDQQPERRQQSFKKICTSGRSSGTRLLNQYRFHRRNTTETANEIHRRKTTLVRSLRLERSPNNETIFVSKNTTENIS